MFNLIKYNIHLMFFLIKLLYFYKVGLASSDTKFNLYMPRLDLFKVHLSPKFDYLEAFHSSTLEGLDKAFFR